jgi:hypothetical protein
MAGEARPISTPTTSQVLEALYSEQRSDSPGETDCSRAVIGLSDGSQVPCLVKNLTQTGATLLRTGRQGERLVLHAGDHVAMHLFQPGSGSANSVIVDGTVVEIDGSGMGITLSFGAAEQDEDSPYNDLSSDDWMTEVPEIASLAATARQARRPRPKNSRRVKRLTRSSARNPAATLGVDLGRLIRSTLLVGGLMTSVALFVLLGDLLGAIL